MVIEAFPETVNGLKFYSGLALEALVNKQEILHQQWEMQLVKQYEIDTYILLLTRPREKERERTELTAEMLYALLL